MNAGDAVLRRERAEAAEAVAIWAAVRLSTTGPEQAAAAEAEDAAARAWMAADAAWQASCMQGGRVVSAPGGFEEFDVWAQQVRDDLVPKLHASAVFAHMVPEDGPNVKMAVELGMAILLDKPIILIVIPGRAVTDRLARAADAILEWDGQNPDLGRRVAETMTRLVADGGAS